MISRQLVKSTFWCLKVGPVYHPPAGERMGSELRHLPHAAEPWGFSALCSHRACSQRSWTDPLTLGPHLPRGTGALRRKWEWLFFLFFCFFNHQSTISAFCMWFVLYHKWRRPAGVSWCRGSTGPQRFGYLPGLNSLCGRDTCETLSSKLRATNTLQSNTKKWVLVKSCYKFKIPLCSSVRQ